MQTRERLYIQVQLQNTFLIHSANGELAASKIEAHKKSCPVLVFPRLLETNLQVSGPSGERTARTLISRRISASLLQTCCWGKET